jgi:hypothetical protein
MATCRANGVAPHVARNNGRTGGSAIDACTTRWPGYAISQRKRKRIEEVFGWGIVSNYRVDCFVALLCRTLTVGGAGRSRP